LKIFSAVGEFEKQRFSDPSLKISKADESTKLI